LVGPVEVMPPVAKKRKAEEPLASKAGRMLMQCSRSALEEMLLAAVQSGTPVTLSHIEDALPDPQPLAAKPAAVESGPARTGTGFFDVVSGEQHLDIFRKLSLRDRLTVCIAVCKAWRAFRSEPSLWRVIDGFPRGGAHAWINAKGFHRLMRWLPKDCAEVYSYISHSKLDDKVMDAACICEGMKLHRRWVGGITKSQPDPYSAPVLKSLTLRGKRVASTVLRTASALFGSSLERIDIGGHNNRKVAIKVCRDPPPRPLSLGLCMTVMSPPQDILKLVSATPRLKYLETHTLRAVDVASIAATLRKCRGGAPLITHLISDPDGNFVS
jgi:hypothetical protein